MPRDYLRTTEEPASQAAQALNWRALLIWSVAILLAALAWLRLQMIVTGPFRHAVNPVLAWSSLGILFIHAVLVVTIERGLAFTGLFRKWRYRLAFLFSAGLPIIHWTILLAVHAYPGELWVPLVEVLISACGAFLGSLVATGMNEGLWENNSPPAQQTQEEVLRLHRERIGKPPRQPWAKRLFDVVFAWLGLVVSAPVWLVCILIIWFEDPGPILFVKNSVGKGGINFRQLKFRTMVPGAETNTGPVLSQKGDERVLVFGRLLRKTALDEMPQLINILRGEMSFVGPRPQRTVLVRGYLEKMPEYAERHKVLPGLAGLAQVAGDYYLTPRQKLRIDRLYIRYSSLGFDLKLIFLAFSITLWYRWQEDWSGRLPRRLLH
jgi:lipopolysaccharide/colanic/teichoic acid biosynthesis glycosyltransferase